MSKTKKSSSGSKGSSTTKKSTTSTAEINQVKQQLNTVKSSLQLESSSLAPMEGTLNTLKELKTRLETAIDTLRNQKDGIEDKYTLDSGWRGPILNNWIMLNYFTFNIFNIGLLLAVIIGIGLITSLITCIKALKSKPIKIIKNL